MLLRFPLLRRTSIVPALLTVALITASSAQITAQAPSSAIASLQPVAQADRIPEHPDFAPLTQLDHQLPGWVAGASQSSARSIDLGITIHATLILSRSAAAQTAFEQLLADQQNHSSPLYHQWLTPQQVGQLFGPTPNDLARLSSWLTSQGLKVDSVSASGVLVSVSGSAAVLGNAFHTSFAIFDLASATGNPIATGTRLSAVAEPSIPTALTPLVRSIQGLAQVSVHPMNHATALKRPTAAPGVRPQYTNTYMGSTSYFIMPDDFAVIYDIAGVYSGGNKGATIGSTPQRIAVIGVSAVDNTDITDFETITGLSTSDLPTVVVPPGSTSPGITGTGAQDEATLDVDRVIATAPGAGVDLVIAADTSTTSGLFTAALWNVSNLKDPVMSISFGGCEVDNPTGPAYVDSFASAGAAEGITTLVSSGDSGAAGCETSFQPVTGTQVASVNFICSSTYVTCVGGTEFNDTSNPTAYWSATNSTPGYESALGYIPEGGWNEPSSVNASNVTVYAPAASGGGVSVYIAKPTWQTGSGVPSGSFRFVPDVSFSASAHDGYFACLAYAGGNCEQNYFEDFSGTSAAAPGMAGIVALINTKTGSASGNINPTLYATATSTPSAFHDATIATSGVTNCTASTPSMCNNSTPGPTGLSGGLAGFKLTTGYDEVTGLGSIDVANLIAAVSGSGGGGTPGFTLTASPTTLSATTTASSSTTDVTGKVTSQITVTSTNSFAGILALSCAITPTTASVLPTCALSPSTVSVSADGTVTSTATISYYGSSLGACDPPVASNTTPWQPVSGILVAGLLLLVLPLRKRRSIRALSMACLLTAGLASITGCGGGSQTTHTCTPPTIPGTTAGSYTVTITGTSGSTTASTTVALTIN